MPSAEFRLNTERLCLRELSPDDAEDMYRLNADPEVLRHTGDEPFANVSAARAFLENYDAYRRHGMGRWAVIRKDDDAFLGWCGLKYNEDIAEVDLGFRLMQAYWNRGYATESANACLAYGFEVLQLASIIGRVHQVNKASVAVLEKIGMRRESDTLMDADAPAFLYRITRVGWQAIHK